jgi:hypothetical protein
VQGWDGGLIRSYGLMPVGECQTMSTNPLVLYELRDTDNDGPCLTAGLKIDRKIESFKLSW